LNIQNRHQKFNELRERYTSFTFESYHYEEDSYGLRIGFEFNLNDEFRFTPSMCIPKKDYYHWEIVGRSGLDNLIFHLGMIEMVSYWKLTCSPKVLIRPHLLGNEQISWWKKLYFNGLGEFLYLNGIQIEQDDLMEITTFGEPLSIHASPIDPTKVMVPIGGGKDSVVTLEVLKSSGAKVFPMSVNPRPAINRTIEQAGFSMPFSMEVQRKLDPLMLELNRRGFLNGHTPFSALLAFTSVLLAVGSGIGNIALSNESSANDSTVPGTRINHQYSKSFEFEQDFDAYCRTYIHPEVRYFSFLRPINELQIARLFSGLKAHHPGFRSCNVESKNDRWCGNCPKCLFTYIILAPFISAPELVQIFGSDLLKNKELKTSFEELTGKSPVKPFECVGTPDEVNSAINQVFSPGQPLPLLLSEYPFNQNYKKQFELLLNGFSDEHTIPSVFLSTLKKALHDQLA
jgi:hypothetical protein